MRLFTKPVLFPSSVTAAQFELKKISERCGAAAGAREGTGGISQIPPVKDPPKFGSGVAPMPERA